MEEISILEKMLNGIKDIFMCAVPPLAVYLGVPAIITAIVNMLLKKNIKKRMIRIVINCFIFMVFLVVMIAPGCYVKRH